jgi:hypothetical protein
MAAEDGPRLAPTRKVRHGHHFRGAGRWSTAVLVKVVYARNGTLAGNGGAPYGTPIQAQIADSAVHREHALE